MRLTELAITTMPGIEPGFTVVGIHPGLNIVSGPNAIGKSSLLRAVSLLVREPRAGDPPVSLLARLVDPQGQEWRVSRTGRDVVWTQDGVTTSAPRFPDADQLRTYLVSLESLLKAQDNDAAFAGQVMRILRGGYDLQALRNIPDLSTGPNHGKAEGKRLLAASKTQRNVVNEYNELRRQQAELPAIEGKLKQARDDAGRINGLTDALGLVEVNARITQLDAQLGQFPPDMGALLGREEQELADLRGVLETLHRKLAQSQADADSQERVLSESGLTAPWPSVDAITSQQEIVHQGQVEEATRNQRREELRSARNRLAVAKEALGGGPNVVPDISPDAVSRAEDLARRIQSSCSRVADLEGQLRTFTPTVVTESDMDRLRRGIDALRAWQSTSVGTPSRVPLLIALVFALGALLVSAVAKVWIAAALAGAVLAALLWAVLNTAKSPIASGRAAFEREGLEPPTAWTSDGVRALLTVLEERLVTLQMQRNQEIQAREVRRQLDNERASLSRLEEEKRQLAAAVGFLPDYSVLALDRFVSLVTEYHQADLQIRNLEADLAELDAKIDETVVGAQALLEQAGCRAASDSVAAVKSALNDLLRRVQAAESATRDAEVASSQIEALQQDIEAAQAKMTNFWRRLGLTADDESELLTRLGLRDSWQQRRQEKHDALVEKTRLKSALEDQRELLLLAEAENAQELQDRLERAREAAAAVETLLEQTTSIRTRLEAAGTDLRLEAAKADVEQARQDLADARDDVLTSCAAQFLLADVEQSYTSQHEPEILRTAKSRFAAFTQHTFALELDQEGNLCARDVSKNARRSLAELSSATRMQLLLAVRIAWAEHIERDAAALPLFLDEALTTSDVGRFTEVARAVEQIVVGSDRQVFYLSARHDDVSLWRRLTGMDVHHIDLAAIRGAIAREEADSAEVYELEVRSEIPAPGGFEAEQYAEALGVPMIRPESGAQSIHIFHLLRDDLELLHELMSTWRVVTVGQLDHLLGLPGGQQAVPDAERRAELDARCRAAVAWVDAWKVGRGKKVGRLDLEKAPAVSEAFANRVAELAERVDGSAKELLACLREGQVQRFRSANIEQLHDWLEEMGFLDPRQPLDLIGRRTAVLGSIADPDDRAQADLLLDWLEATSTP